MWFVTISIHFPLLLAQSIAVIVAPCTTKDLSQYPIDTVVYSEILFVTHALLPACDALLLCSPPNNMSMSLLWNTMNSVTPIVPIVKFSAKEPKTLLQEKAAFGRRVPPQPFFITYQIRSIIRTIQTTFSFRRDPLRGAAIWQTVAAVPTSSTWSRTTPRMPLATTAIRPLPDMWPAWQWPPAAAIRLHREEEEDSLPKTRARAGSKDSRRKMDHMCLIMKRKPNIP